MRRGLRGYGIRSKSRIKPKKRPEILRVDLLVLLEPRRNALRVAILKSSGDAVEQIEVRRQLAARVCASGIRRFARPRIRAFKRVAEIEDVPSIGEHGMQHIRVRVA